MSKLLAFGFVLFLLLSVDPAWAGPGGKIASALFDTFWGKVLCILLVIVFFPLILLNSIRKRLASRRALKDIRYMSNHDPKFNWLDIRQRFHDCFLNVHVNWNSEDLSLAEDWMTSWYWQNQQISHLERWKAEGVINICKVKKVSSIKPILFVHRNGAQAHDGSVLIVIFEAVLKDYLKKRDSDKIVEGNRLYKRVRSVWTFKYDNSAWKVNNIEESYIAMSYAKMLKDLPPIEATIFNKNI